MDLTPIINKAIGQAAIRNQFGSPYVNLDPASQKWVLHLKTIWPVCKKTAQTVSALHSFFSISRNPYISALQAMVSSGDFYLGKKNTLSYFIMESFRDWIQGNNHDILPIPLNLKLDAFGLVLKQKNSSLVTLVAEIFKFVESKDSFIFLIDEMVKRGKFKEACLCATMLQLYDKFKIEDFVIPLVLQDKYFVAEKYVEAHKQNQIDLVRFLDDLLGKKNLMAEIEAFFRERKVTGLEIRIHFKSLSKLVFKIVNKYQLPSSLCSNLMQRKSRGALQFLLHKRFVENSMGGESWEEMVLEAVGTDETLQANLIEAVAYWGHVKEAIMWAKKFNISEANLPYKLLQCNRSGSSDNNSLEEDSLFGEKFDSVSDAPDVTYHRLPIDESNIDLIDSPESFTKFIREVSNEKLVGLDAEWKPSFTFKQNCLSLLQVATPSAVYLIDVIALKTAECQSLWRSFEDVLLSNWKILKLGFGIYGDLAVLKETLSDVHHFKNFKKEGYLDLSSFWKCVTEKTEFQFPFASSTSSTSGSLCTLFELCFGEKLDKSEQFSNWENRPLRRNQIIYAALDAYCLIEIYEAIMRESELQGIPLSGIDSDNKQVVTESKPVEKEKRMRTNRNRNNLGREIKTQGTSKNPSTVEVGTYSVAGETSTEGSHLEEAKKVSGGWNGRSSGRGQ